MMHFLISTHHEDCSSKEMNTEDSDHPCEVIESPTFSNCSLLNHLEPNIKVSHTPNLNYAANNSTNHFYQKEQIPCQLKFLTTTTSATL